MATFQEYLEATKPIKKSNKKEGYLELKWGNIKDAIFASQEEEKLYDQYEKLEKRNSDGTIALNPTREKIILKLINLCNNPKGIYLSWDEKWVSKAKARKYIIEYYNQSLSLLF